MDEPDSPRLRFGFFHLYSVGVIRTLHGWLGLSWRRTKRDGVAALGDPTEGGTDFSSFRPRWAGTAVVAILGGILTLVVFFWFQRGNDARFAEIFRQELIARVELVKHASEQSLEDLGRLRRFMESESSVDRREFSRFGRLLISGAYAVQAFEWIPCVPRSERAEWEARGRQAGFEGFRFTEKGPAGKVVVAGERDAYFPVWFMEPLAGNERAFGFDLGSEPMRRAALEKARDTGEHTGTEPIRLIQETGNQRGFLVFEPVYSQGVSPRTVEERRARLRGFVLGVFRSDDLLRSAVAHRSTVNLPMVVEDASATAHPLRYLSHYGSEFVPNGKEDGVALGWKSLPIEMAGRDWRLHSAPTPAFTLAYRSRNHWFVLPVGLLLTGLVAFSLELLVMGHVRAEALVALRTLNLRKEVEERTRVEAQFREKNALLTGLLNSASDIVFFKDSRGAYLGCNPSAEELIGRPLEEIIGRTDHDLFPREVADAFREDDRLTMEALVPRHIKEWLTYPDGRKLLMETAKSPLRDFEGKLLGIVGVGRDITEIERRASLLLESEERFRGMFDRHKAVMLLVSPETGAIVDANLAAEAFYGYSRERLRTMRIEEINQMPYDQVADQRNMAAQRADNRFIFQHRLADGKVRWVEVFSTPIETGGRNLLFSIIHDITERRIAEEAVRQSEENLRAFFNSIDDFAFVLDEEGNVLQVNQTVVRRLGYEEGDLFGRSVLNVHPEDRRGEAAEQVAGMLSGKVKYCPVPLIARDGRQIPVETRVTPGHWNGRKVLFGISKDISELRLSEEKFAKSFHSNPMFMTLSTVEDGRLLDVNEAFLKGMGYAREEVLGRTTQELGMFMSDRERGAMLQNLKRLGKVRETEMRVRTKSGKVLQGSVSVDLIEMGGGEVLLTVMNDITDRKRAEEELRQSEAFLSQSQTVARVGGWKASPKTNLLVWTDGVRQILELPLDYRPGLEEGLGFYFPEDLPAVRVAVGQAFEEGRSFSLEVRVVTTSGKVLWTELRGLGRIGEGDTAYVMGTLQDVTERRRVEGLLRESAERLALATRVGGVGIWDYHVVSNRLVWDDQMFRLYGITRDQFGGAYEAWQAGLHPEDKQRGDEEIQLALRGEKDFDTEFRVLWPDGSTHHIRALATVQRDAAGKALRMIGTNWDLTEHKQAEEELRKLWNAVEASPTAVMIADVNGKIEYVNPRFTEQTGYRADEVLGQTPRILKSGAHPPEFYGEMWRTLEEGRPWRGEVCNRRKDGALYWESLSISPIRDSRNCVTHFVAVRENITEKKRLAEELLRAKEAADEASRAKSTFLANMSHEIRTPMNAILGYAQLLRRDPSLSAEVKKKLEVVNRSGDHLLMLINQVLEVSKIEAGRSTLAPSVFDPHTLLDDMVSLFRERTEAKMLKIVTAKARGLPRRVVADHGKLRQVLINLLGNAIKFTERGKICLKFAIHKGGDGLLRLAVDVEDTGMGIAKEEMGILFRPFEQTSSGRKIQSGTGLGLAISREYAKLMGGELSATSVVGKGSTFRLVVPVREAGGEDRSSTALRRVVGLKPGQPSIRVLIADDQPDNRAWLKALLEQVGFHVCEAANGEEALAVWKNWSPRLVLMDLRMPGVDGVEATRRIREGDLHGNTVVFILTAALFEKDPQAILDVGAVEILTKPLDEDLLFDRIHAHLKVNFQYEEPKIVPKDAKGSAAPRTGVGAAAKLPEALRKGLREAVAHGDSERLTALVRQVARHDRALAKLMESLVDRYDYDRLARLLARKGAR